MVQAGPGRGLPRSALHGAGDGCSDGQMWGAGGMSQEEVGIGGQGLFFSKMRKKFTLPFIL